MRVKSLIAIALAFAVAAAGCGKEGKDRNKSASLILDFTPNAVHTGIYTALAQGYYLDEGVKLKVREPSTSADSLKLVQSGKADFAIADIHDLGIARESGLKLVAVMAIVERPLASVIALKKSGIATPVNLEGEKVGVTGLPSDDAVLNSVVKNAGGNPSKVSKITIGFNAVGSLIAGKVRAATAFWNAEGVNLKLKGHPVTEFRVDDYGAPSYPELVLVASERTVEKRGKLVGQVVKATVKGYEHTLEKPDEAMADLLKKVPGLDREEMKAQLDVLLPVFKGRAKKAGYLDPAILRRWAEWDLSFGILKRTPQLDKAFTNSFL